MSELKRLNDEKIELKSKAFWDKYSGKGLSPSEVMELHKSEYWQNILDAQLEADQKMLEQVKREMIDALYRTCPHSLGEGTQYYAHACDCCMESFKKKWLGG